MNFISKNLEETKKFAADLIGYLKSGAESREGATLVCLSGDLGAGKTTLTQFVAGHLDIEENITSPTFVIEKIYKLKSPIFKHLIHIDAYRLKSGEELKNLGWDEIIKDRQNLIFLEWPENVKEILPENAFKVKLETVDEKTREIYYGN